MTFDEEVAAAKKRVADMDKMDGFPDRFLTTVHAALEAGLRNPKNGAAYDALVMLTDVIKSGKVKIAP